MQFQKVMKHVVISAKYVRTLVSTKVTAAAHVQAARILAGLTGKHTKKNGNSWINYIEVQKAVSVDTALFFKSDRVYV